MKNIMLLVLFVVALTMLGCAAKAPGENRDSVIKSAEKFVEKEGKCSDELEVYRKTSRMHNAIVTTLKRFGQYNEKNSGTIESFFKFFGLFKENEIEELVLADETIRKWMDGKDAKKVIIVPKKIVNVVL